MAQPISPKAATEQVMHVPKKMISGTVFTVQGLETIIRNSPEGVIFDGCRVILGGKTIVAIGKDGKIG